MGSGKNLKRAISKYGVENFIKEVLHVFDNEEEMNAKEAELVTEEFCLQEDNYNLCSGGKGGFSYVNRTILNKEKRSLGRKKADSILYEKYGITNPAKMSSSKEKIRHKLKLAWKNGKMPKPTPWPAGKPHTEDSKLKMSQSSKGKCMGNKNSQYGTMWITDGAANRKIIKDHPVPNGWKKGRS